MNTENMVLIDVEPGDAADFDRRFLERNGHPVVMCRGPDHASLCPILSKVGCPAVGDAHGIVFALDLDRPRHRAILARYCDVVRREVPIRVVVHPGRREKYRELLDRLYRHETALRALFSVRSVCVLGEGDGMVINAGDYIDTDRYPIDESGATRGALISGLREQIENDGCAVLRGFVRATRMPELVAECNRVSRFGHRNFTRTNPYFTADRPDLPETHPLRRFYDRSNAFVPADNFGDESILRAIYEWPAFAPFIQDALGETEFYRYADPLADVIVNLAEAGGGFPWHFDTNNYTVTLAIQNAEHGGDFEFSPHLRTSTEENYAGVEAVLGGDSSLIHTLRLQPGDLQIFKGRYSLHRVAPLVGPTPRYVAIFSYVEVEGMVGSPDRTVELYGRILPVHIERAGLRNDALID